MQRLENWNFQNRVGESTSSKQRKTNYTQFNLKRELERKKKKQKIPAPRDDFCRREKYKIYELAISSHTMQQMKKRESDRRNDRIRRSGQSRDLNFTSGFTIRETNAISVPDTERERGGTLFCCSEAQMNS